METLPGSTDEQVRWMRDSLLSWFEQCGRAFPWRETGRSGYEVIVAEILLQRTTARAVARAYTPLLEYYPSWSSLRRASLEELRLVLRPLGLWRQKADALLALAHSLEELDDALPASRGELERLRGVGPYTASAVLAAVYGRQEPLVDVNAVRVLGRFFGMQPLPAVGNRYLHALARRLVAGERSLSVSWAVLDLAALLCRAVRPLCDRCPLSTACASFAHAGTAPLNGLTPISLSGTVRENE